MAAANAGTVPTKRAGGGMPSIARDGSAGGLAFANHCASGWADRLAAARWGQLPCPLHEAIDDTMSFLTHVTFSVMLLLALLAGLWSHQR